MHIYYENGPPSVTMGAAGTFKKGVSRDIDDKLAEQLLAKKSIVFKEGEKSAAPEEGPSKEVETPSADQFVGADKLIEAPASHAAKKPKEATNVGN